MAEGKLFIILIVINLFIFQVISDTQIRGLEVIPERIEVTYVNSKYMANATVNVRRYSRRSPYVVNVWGTTKHIWANNVSLNVIFHEYLHNEYKRSFMEIHYKLCDLINKEVFIGGILRKHGITCPIKKGDNKIVNTTMSFPTFPDVFPFEKFKAEIVLKTEPSHEIIATGFLYVIAKQAP